MAVQDSINNVITKALNRVETNPVHNLNLGYRQAVWKEMGPVYDIQNPGDRQGVTRRSLLAFFAAKRVLPIWEKVWTADKTPHDILKEALHYLKTPEEITHAIAGEKVQKFWSWLENFEYDDKNNEQQHALSGACAAVQTLSHVFYDNIFDPADIDLETEEDAVDSYDADASYYAVTAYAEGSIWEDNSNSIKRRAFWEWWLQEAVPNAWALKFDYQKS